jgi:AcrR family transcriptional regulator
LDQREKIVESGLQQFMKHGIRSVSMARLVEPLGISTKTLYRYFKSKEDLLQDCLNLHYSRQAEALKKLLAGKHHPVHLLTELFQATLKEDFGINHRFYHDLNYYYPALQDRAIGKQAAKFRKIIQGIIEKGIAEDYFMKQLHPEVVMTGIEMLYSIITRTGKFRHLKLKPEDLFSDLVGVYIRGICTPRGLAAYTQIK